jgi:hypothetical protein
MELDLSSLKNITQASKFILETQARSINQYKNVKNGNIHFHQQCIIKDLIPKFAKIKILNISPDRTANIFVTN